MKIKVGIGNDKEIFIEIPYSEELIRKIKTIGNIKWDRTLKQWRAPFHPKIISKLADIFPSDDLEFDSRLKQFLVHNTSTQHFFNSELEKLKDELRLKGYSQKTIKAYMGHVRRLLMYFNGKPPIEIKEEDIRTYFLYLVKDKNTSHAYVNKEDLVQMEFCISI